MDVRGTRGGRDIHSLTVNHRHWQSEASVSLCLDRGDGSSEGKVFIQHFILYTDLSIEGLVGFLLS